MNNPKLKWPSVWLFLPIVLIILPFFFHNQYILQIANLSSIYIILNLAMHLMMGEAGLINLGQAGFYGLGAYAAALLALEFNLPFPITFLAGGLISAFVGFVVALFSMKLKGLYFALISLSVAEIIRIITLVWMDVTRGPMGLPGIPRPKLFGYSFPSNNEPYFILMVILVLITYLTMYWIQHSNFGLALNTIRDSEHAAASLGINVFWNKTIAFVIGCFFTGLAGSFYAHFFTYVGPTFGWHQTMLVLTMSMLGALAGLPGAVMAAILLTTLPEILRPLAMYRQVFYGVLLIVLIIYGQSYLGQRLKRRLKVDRLQTQDLQKGGQNNG